jgi:DNA polymerase-3 subunit alpha
VEFYKEAKKRNIKPIIGVETYMAFESRNDKRPNIDSKSYHMILLAKYQQGYQNLVKLITLAHLEGYYYKPRIDEEIYREIRRRIDFNIIVLGGKNSPITFSQ